MFKHPIILLLAFICVSTVDGGLLGLILGIIFPKFGIAPGPAPAPAPKPPPTAPPTSVCRNTQADSTADEGCDINKPLCVAADGSPIPLDSSGDKCVVCRNSKTDGTADLGCEDTPDTPLCVAEDGSPIPVNSAGGRCDPCTIGSTGIFAMCLALDESGSVGATNFDIEKMFAMDVIDAFERANPIMSEYGIVSFASSADIDIDLTTAEQAKQQIQGITYSGGGTAIDDALVRCNSVLQGSTATQKILILLTDGMNNAGSGPVITAATDIKNEGVTIVSIGIGNNVDEATLQAAASSMDLFFPTTFDDLMNLVEKILGAPAPVCVG